MKILNPQINFIRNYTYEKTGKTNFTSYFDIDFWPALGLVFTIEEKFQGI